MQINITPFADIASKICWHTENTKFTVYGDSMILQRYNDGTLYCVELHSMGVMIATLQF